MNACPPPCPPSAGPAARAALAVILCWSLFGRSAGADGEEPAPQGPIERIEVRETSEPLDAALDSTAFATVIRADDFADRVTTVEQLLRESVGVQASSLGGAFATVSIRSSSAEQVVVYLDGVPLNRALGGGVNLADLPLAQIESIEIYRSFTPASLPSASIGGAIVINTRDGSGSRGGTASATIGSFSSAEATFSFGATRERSSFNIGLDASTSEGDFAYTDTDGTQSLTGDDTQAHRQNNDFDRVHLSGRLSTFAGDRTQVKLSADLLSRQNGASVVGNLQSETARFETSRLLLRPEFETTGLLGGLLLIRGALDFTRVREQFDDRDGELGLPQSTDNLISSFGQEFGATLIASAHQALSILAAHRTETADLVKNIPTTYEIGLASRDTTTFVLEDQIAVAGSRVLINPSVRYLRYSGDFRPGQNGAIPNELPDAAAFTTGKIGLRYEINERYSVKGNFGSFVRLPDFLELFGNRGAVIGNPLLQPEEGLSFDAGLVATHGPAGGIVRQFQLEMTYFETLAENLIQFVPTGQNWVRARNTGRARIRGVEMGISLMLGPRFTGSLNATRQDAVSNGGDIFDGYFLVGRPRDELSTRMELSLGRWNLYHAFTYVGPNYLDNQNTESRALPARYLHDVGTHVTLGGGLSAGFEIKNIADQETFDVARFPLPGRRIVGRLIWAF